MNKNPHALEELYDRFAKLVYSFAYRSTRHSDASRDIVQLVFTRLWTTQSTYDPLKGKFVNWILTITRHITIDYLRKERRQRDVVTVSQEHWKRIYDPYKDDPGEIVTESLQEHIRDAYRYLSAAQKELIELLYWQGYSLSEIAQKNNEPLGTVKSRLNQTLKVLRRHLLIEKGG